MWVGDGGRRRRFVSGRQGRGLLGGGKYLGSLSRSLLETGNGDV